jgi:hypothetical protein
MHGPLPRGVHSNTRCGVVAAAMQHPPAFFRTPPAVSEHFSDPPSYCFRTPPSHLADPPSGATKMRDVESHNYRGGSERTPAGGAPPMGALHVTLVPTLRLWPERPDCWLMVSTSHMRNCSKKQTGITRLQRYYEPLRHPKAPGLSLTGFRLVIADHALGLPVFRALSLCTCCRHYPGAVSGRTASLTSPSRISLPRKGRRVGLRIVLFEACSAFTRVTACTLAPSPIRDALSEGFSHFVTSIAAPVASGWSGCRVGLAPTGKRPLVTAHTRTGPSRSGMASHRLC